MFGTKKGTCLLIGLATTMSVADSITGAHKYSMSGFIGESFTCDGSIVLPLSAVNDDYCDCEDGSDEPGSSACPNGRFWCANRITMGTAAYEHVLSEFLPSSRVNDGICDCCDGSDEIKTCENTCGVLWGALLVEKRHHN